MTYPPFADEEEDFDPTDYGPDIDRPEPEPEPDEGPILTYEDIWTLRQRWEPECEPEGPIYTDSDLEAMLE